jgi:hypothetical protein
LCSAALAQKAVKLGDRRSSALMFQRISGDGATKSDNVVEDLA